MANTSANQIIVTSRVGHPRFGIGTVVGMPTTNIAVVRFDNSTVGQIRRDTKELRPVQFESGIQDTSDD